MPHTIKLAEVPDRHFTTWAERLIGLVLVVLLGVCGWLVYNARKAEERGYVNRAQACRIQALLGAELDASCLKSEVVQHYDPAEKPTTGVNSQGQQINRDLLCQLVETVGATSPHCEG